MRALSRVLLLGLVLTGCAGEGIVLCPWKVDGEAIGGQPEMTYGEYAEEVREQSSGCTQVILIGLDGEEVADPDPDTPIESMTGQVLSSPITVHERPAVDS